MRPRRFMMLAVFFLLAFLIWGNGIPLLSAQEKPGWQMEWEKTAEEATKEGQVSVYFSGVYGGIVDSGVFQKRYPKIKVTTVRGRGSQMEQRIMAERRAERYLVDVFQGGLNSTYSTLYQLKVLEPIRPLLILPEVVDESKWLQGRHRYADPQKEQVFIFVGNSSAGSISYNTHLINPKEFGSFWDFLRPPWRGKLLVRDIRGGGTGASSLRFYYYHPDLGPGYIRRLFGEMDATLFRDNRQGPDWLAHGKFPICFFCPDIDLAISQGLQVGKFNFMKEGAGLSPGSGSLAFLNKAPHPNASKVFINWFLSREGQFTLQKTLARAGYDTPDSLRIDIPKDDVPAENRRVEGVRYFDTGTSEQLSMEPIYKVVEEALQQATKKK